jgi:hypothetical protein
MTAEEKKRMLTVIRATEFLFAENAALKTVLLAHGIPLHVWEREAERLVLDPELSPRIRAIFQHLYDEIEHAGDETKAVQELLKALPKPTKGWN